MQIFFRLAAIMTLMLFLASIAACQATSPRGEEGDDNEESSVNRVVIALGGRGRS